MLQKRSKTVRHCLGKAEECEQSARSARSLEAKERYPGSLQSSVELPKTIRDTASAVEAFWSRRVWGSGSSSQFARTAETRIDK
jgi:hypothetical protein